MRQETMRHLPIIDAAGLAAVISAGWAGAKRSIPPVGDRVPDPGNDQLSALHLACSIVRLAADAPNWLEPLQQHFDHIRAQYEAGKMDADQDDLTNALLDAYSRIFGPMPAEENARKVWLAQMDGAAAALAARMVQGVRDLPLVGRHVPERAKVQYSAGDACHMQGRGRCRWYDYIRDNQEWADWADRVVGSSLARDLVALKTGGNHDAGAEALRVRLDNAGRSRDHACLVSEEHACVAYFVTHVMSLYVTGDVTDPAQLISGKAVRVTTLRDDSPRPPREPRYAPPSDKMFVRVSACNRTYELPVKDINRSSIAFWRTRTDNLLTEQVDAADYLAGDVKAGMEVTILGISPGTELPVSAKGTVARLEAQNAREYVCVKITEGVELFEGLAAESMEMVKRG